MSDFTFTHQIPLTLEPEGPKSCTPPELVQDMKDKGLVECSSFMITPENDHLYENFSKLHKLAHQGRKADGEPLPGGWGTEKSVTYTPEMTGCSPTMEEILQLVKWGVVFHGKIVCTGGEVYNADMAREIEELDTPGSEDLFKKYPKVWYRQEHIAKSSIHGVDVRKPAGSPDPESPGGGRQHFITEKVLKPPDSLTLSEEGSLESGFPSGEYKKKNQDFSRGHISICDNRDCCMISHVFLGLYNAGSLPHEKENVYSKENFEKFLRERVIYSRKDEQNGNMDLCYPCLYKASK
jgi:hypothetical protein